MITHIVLFNLGDKSTKSIQSVVDVLKSMEGKITELKSIEIGVDVTNSDRSYDIALITKFDSVEDMEAYQINPFHINVVEYVSSVGASTVTVDFES